VLQPTSFKLGGNSVKCGMDARNSQYLEYSFNLTETATHTKQIREMLHHFHRHQTQCTQAMITQTTWQQTLFWTGQVPSIQTCTSSYLVPSSVPQGRVAVQYREPCSYTHINSHDMNATQFTLIHKWPLLSLLLLSVTPWNLITRLINALISQQFTGHLS